MHIAFVVSPALLIAGYVARVEQSELARLRALCDAAPRHAERLLALDVARYLIDAGVAPLLAPIAQRALPPAALDPAAPRFLLDARLYRTSNPGALVLRTYRELWANLRRMRTRRCDGAFLVMFCRRGRLIELPVESTRDGAIIYSATIDLADAGESPDRPVAFRF